MILANTIVLKSYIVEKYAELKLLSSVRSSWLFGPVLYKVVFYFVYLLVCLFVCFTLVLAY